MKTNLLIIAFLTCFSQAISLAQCCAVDSVNYNSFGMGAGPSITTTGIYDQGVGVVSLSQLTCGFGNVAFGPQTLMSVTDHGYNTACGSAVLRANTADNNSGFGNSALLFNITGTDNTGGGNQALMDNVTGNELSAWGNYSQNCNIDGSYNTSSGSCSSFYNKHGNNNTSDGYDALNHSLTSASTATGVNSLFNQDYGFSNSAFGYMSGYSPRNAAYCTFLGYETDSSIDNPTNSTAIGCGAIITDNNQVVIGGEDVTATILHGTLYINHHPVSFGPPDSAGTGFRLMRIEN